MEKSILLSIKKQLGIAKEDTAFDDDIILLINSAFMTVYQLGVGNSDHAFRITGLDETWEDFLQYRENLEDLKEYIYLKVKLVFDPPESSAVLQAFQNLIKEHEWRLKLQGRSYEY